MMKRILAAAAAAAVLTATVAAPAMAAARPGTQARLDRLTTVDGLAGAVVSVRDTRGGIRTWTSGTAERGTGRPMVGAGGRFRIASVTKTFTAVTVLRLAEQGKVRLDQQVETYLPGALDGRRITVRQLLQQTSGLPEYFDLVDWTKPATDADLLKLALTRDPVHEPGARWSYSNTNYLVLGMIVSKVAGKDFRTLPLRLSDTYWPAQGELDLRGEHAHTYGVSPADPKAGMVDTTLLPGYGFGAAGGLVSTPDDLNRFWQAIPGRTWRAMTRHTVPADDPAGAKYGLGVYSYPLSCGPLWMHDGGLPGVRVLSGRDRAGRAVTAYVTGTPKNDKHLFAVLDSALCDPSR